MSSSLRTGVIALLLGGGGTIPACSGKVQDSGLPPGCEGVLKQRGSGGATCHPSARCAQIEQDPKKEYDFSFSFTPMADPKAANCLADLLKGRGAQATVESWNGMSVSGSFEAIERALEYEIVDSYEVLTCTGGCTECAGLSTEQCGQDAFCATITGKRFNPTQVCLEAVEAIGCWEAPNGCIPEPLAVVDPQGVCWAVDCSGAPPGWRPVASQSCSGSDLLNTPACP